MKYGQAWARQGDSQERCLGGRFYMSGIFWHIWHLSPQFSKGLILVFAVVCGDFSDFKRL